MSAMIEGATRIADLFDVTETLGLKDYGKFDGTEWTVESLPLHL